MEETIHDSNSEIQLGLPQNRSSITKILLSIVLRCKSLKSSGWGRYEESEFVWQLRDSDGDRAVDQHQLHNQLAA
jgi:hypothetical protein